MRNHVGKVPCHDKLLQETGITEWVAQNVVPMSPTSLHCLREFQAMVKSHTCSLSCCTTRLMLHLLPCPDPCSTPLVQKMTDDYVKQIETIFKQKEKVG